jgi:hypothetical protein
MSVIVWGFLLGLESFPIARAAEGFLVLAIRVLVVVDSAFAQHSLLPCVQLRLTQSRFLIVLRYSLTILTRI